MKYIYLIFFTLTSVALTSVALTSVALTSVALTSVLNSAVFVAKVSQNPVTQGVKFRLVFELDAQGSNFKAPNFTGFNVLAGPNQSTSMQIVNGRMSQSITYTYILSAKKIGKFYIGPASVKVDGKRIKTKRVEITVLEPSQAEKQRRKQVAQQEKDLNKQAIDIISKNLYIRASIDKKNIYMGEQILATYKLYAHSELDIKGLSHDKTPSFNGFWAQVVGSGEPQWKREVIDGVPFRTAIIKQLILFPQQSGRLSLDPMEFKSVVRLRTGNNNRRRNSFFDDFFDRGSFKNFDYVVKSKKININVKGLPSPPPHDFNGGVGTLNMEAWFDKTHTVSGEPVTLKIKISGNGNLKLVDEPVITFPNGFEVYDPRVVDNVTVRTSGTSGNIIFEYLMIPQNPGEFKISPITLSYFDLSKESYTRLSSQEFIISVGKGEQLPNGFARSGVSKENLQFIGKDIRFIKTETTLKRKSSSFFATWFYYILVVLSPIGVLIIFFYRKNQDKLNSDKSALRTRKASKVAQKRLSLAKKYLDENNLDNFHEELLAALWGYLSDKLSIDRSDLNKESAQNSLEIKNVDRETIETLNQTIETCEFARYAASTQASSPQQLYKNGEEVISRLEDLL